MPIASMASPRITRRPPDLKAQNAEEALYALSHAPRKSSRTSPRKPNSSSQKPSAEEVDADQGVEISFRGEGNPVFFLFRIVAGEVALGRLE